MKHPTEASRVLLGLLACWPLLLGLVPDAQASQWNLEQTPAAGSGNSSTRIAVTHLRPASPDAEPAPPAPPPPLAPWVGRHGHARSEGRAIISVGRDSTLHAGEHADAVVSIFGSSTSAGEIADAVVSIFGDTRVTGPVGDAAVSILGNTYVDSAVHGDVVAVLGNVELGPHANLDGQAVSIGGTVVLDPAAVVQGGVQSISFGARLADFGWLRTWITHCLLYGRLLAFAPGLAWAWTIALVTLAAYVLTALLFGPSVERCVQTLDRHPGKSTLAALLTTLATPILLLLLSISVIGILAIPFVGLSLLLAESFGKLVMLAWIGRRVTKSGSAGIWAHPASAVLIGGLIVTAVYLIPVLGLVTYKLLGFIGLGVVVYTLLLALQARRATQSERAATAGAATSSAAAANAPGAGPHGPAPAGAVAPNEIGPGAAHAAAPAAAAPAGAVAAVAMAAYPRAGFWIRMGALFIDIVLIGVILHFAFSAERLHLLLLAGYGAVMWKLKGATVGGIVFDLRVVRLDGRELDWVTAIVRALACFLSLFIVGLGFIWIAIDDEHQAWHDKIAGTVVVRVPRSTASA